MIEKHGALWYDDGALGQLVFEDYHPSETLVAVFRKEDGYFRVRGYSRVADPQWALLIWEDSGVGGVFTSEQEAVNYALSLHRDKTSATQSQESTQYRARTWKLHITARSEARHAATSIR